MPVEPDPATLHTNLWLNDQNMASNMAFYGKGHVLGGDQRNDPAVLPSWIESTFPWRVSGRKNGGEGEGEGKRMKEVSPVRNTGRPKL